MCQSILYIVYVLIGFRRGLASPCVFCHSRRKLRAVIHGDDFTLLGHGNDLDWFREQISGNFEVKFRGRLGPGSDDDKSIRIPNRIAEWKQDAIHYGPKVFVSTALKQHCRNTFTYTESHIIKHGGGLRSACDIGYPLHALQDD